VPVAVGVEESDSRCGQRDSDQGPDDSPQCRPHEDGGQRDPGVDVHRAAADPWGEQIRLHLLVDGGEQQDPQRGQGRGEHHEQHRDDNPDVGSDDRNELREQPDEQSQRQPVRDPGDVEERAVEDRRQGRELDLGDDVAAGLGDGDIPHRHEHVLMRGREPGADRAAHPRPVGGQVEREHDEREHVEQGVEQRGHQSQNAPGQIGGHRPDLAGGQLQTGGDRVRVELQLEGAVRPGDHLGHHPGQGLDQVGQLGEEHVAEQDADHGDHYQDAPTDQPGGQPAADAPARQSGHRRLHRHGEQPGQQQQEEEPADRREDPQRCHPQRHDEQDADHGPVKGLRLEGDQPHRLGAGEPVR
jgi:hypothetical protein